MGTSKPFHPGYNGVTPADFSSSPEKLAPPCVKRLQHLCEILSRHGQLLEWPRLHEIVVLPWVRLLALSTWILSPLHSVTWHQVNLRSNGVARNRRLVKIPPKTPKTPARRLSAKMGGDVGKGCFGVSQYTVRWAGPVEGSAWILGDAHHPVDCLSQQQRGADCKARAEKWILPSMRLSRARFERGKKLDQMAVGGQNFYVWVWKRGATNNQRGHLHGERDQRTSGGGRRLEVLNYFKKISIEHTTKNQDTRMGKTSRTLGKTISQEKTSKINVSFNISFGNSKHENKLFTWMKKK